MNKKLPNISDAEWQVMKVLWENSPLTAAKIIDEIIPETKWSRKTVHTLLRRLVKKGVVHVEKNNPYIYYPLYEEELCMKEETKSFLNRVYNGSLQLLMANFLRNERLSSQEIEELKNILNESENGDDER